MTNSCLNQSLISNAVAGTGANLSILIHALTPLCSKSPPPPSPQIESIANSLSLVVVGYVCGFLPWGFLALVDFISAKWKTVRATRRAGLLHLLASVFPMVFVIAYAVIQGLSGDYKEMMTAVMAVVLTAYHMGRTAWGLAQLHEYVRWCKHTLECIRATRPKNWDDEFENGTDYDEGEEVVDWDRELMVNSDVVDNEFSGRDISVRLSWKNWPMKVSNPIVCTVRWSAAFLCSLGHKWKSMESKPLPHRLEFFLTRSTLFIDDGPLKTRHTSLWQLSEVLLSKGSNCGAFGGNICKYLVSGNEAFKSNKFEFENIVSSYPAGNLTDKRFTTDIEQNRLDARVEMVEYILSSRILYPSKLQSITSYSEMLREKFLCFEQVCQALDFLQEQIGIERAEKIYCWDVHSFWKITIMPVCSAIPNVFLLQTSVVVDNYESYWFARSLREEDLEGKQLVQNDVFEFCSTLLKSREFDFDRYFLGVSLDCVRTLLAHWVLRYAQSMNTMTWFPNVPTDEIRFVVSEYFCDKVFLVNEGVVSECQQVVHSQIMHHGTETQHLPTSLPMIVLAILSYPALHVARTDDDQSEVETAEDQSAVEAAEGPVEYRIRPILAPQNLFLSLSVDGSTGESSLRIVAEEDDINFDWEKWINATLALMKSRNEIVKSKQSKGSNDFVGPLELIKKVDLSRPMLTLSRCEDDAELSDLPGDIHVWTAWPIFDVRFCQFELDQWMFAGGPLQAGEIGNVNQDYAIRKTTAKKILKKMAAWDRT